MPESFPIRRGRSIARITSSILPALANRTHPGWELLPKDGVLALYPPEESLGDFGWDFVHFGWYGRWIYLPVPFSDFLRAEGSADLLNPPPAGTARIYTDPGWERIATIALFQAVDLFEHAKKLSAALGS